MHGLTPQYTHSVLCDVWQGVGILCRKEELFRIQFGTTDWFHEMAQVMFCILIIKTNEMHCFSNLFWRRTPHRTQVPS
jgi:hypothetical protein